MSINDGENCVEDGHRDETFKTIVINNPYRACVRCEMVTFVCGPRGL
jgi:hypothetical protein